MAPRAVVTGANSGIGLATALRLARYLGTTPEFWLNAQRAVDLWDTAEAIRKDVSRIKPLSAA